MSSGIGNGVSIAIQQYRYLMYAFRGGKFIVMKEKSMESDTLAIQTGGKVGKEAFLELINRWNKQGMQTNQSDMMYVHVALT